MDEPTNHLDMKTVEWLEDYLINYPKAVVMVSHDRAFLDAVATGVYELENGALHRYAGNYTQYRQQKLKICRYSAKPTSVSRRRLRTIMSLSTNSSISLRKLRLRAHARPCWHA